MNTSRALGYKYKWIILFTTDGQLANKLMHLNLERVYLVRVFGNVTDDKINKLSSKVKLDDGFSSFKIAKVNSNKSDAKKDIKDIKTNGLSAL